ncbi:MAG TPA: DUF397 domain-containing protein [Streptosporangiaceae bacterium]|nr:DUF397 domain-containing protein [Streptosporangiaceae bacterium]
MTQTSHAASPPTQWRKSSYSTGGNQCVEVAQAGAVIAVRDSKDPGAGHLTFSTYAWATFLDEAKRRSYDL